MGKRETFGLCEQHIDEILKRTSSQLKYYVLNLSLNLVCNTGGHIIFLSAQWRVSGHGTITH